MIEFIVLGIIPGTQIEVTVTHIATLSWLAFVAYCAASSKMKQNT